MPPKIQCDSQGLPECQKEGCASNPTSKHVFNSPFMDTWFQPAENQFITSFLRDANADYRFAADAGSSTISLSFSAVLRNFKSARFLVNAGSFPSSNTTNLKDFVNKEVTTKPGELKYKDLITQLNSVRCGNVWSNQRRVTADGQASDFFESSAYRADFLLADYVSLLHPELGIKKFTCTYSYGPSSRALVGGTCPYQDLNGKAPNGKVFVDRYFIVTGLNRFNIEDLLEDKVLPNASNALKISRASLDIFFTNAQTKNDISLTVRFLVARNDARSFRSTRKILEVLKKTIHKSVKEIRGKEYRKRLIARRKFQMR